MIIDEAHNLPDFLVTFFTVSASSRWPRFDYFNFQVAIDAARDSHPDNVSSETFHVFRQWFLGYHAQEEARLLKLNAALDKLVEASGMHGGGMRMMAAVKESTYTFDGSIDDDNATDYTQDELQDEIAKQSELLYNLSFIKAAVEADVQWIYSPPARSPSPNSPPNPKAFFL